MQNHNIFEYAILLFNFCLFHHFFEQKSSEKNLKIIPVRTNKITDGNFVLLAKISNRYEKIINNGSTINIDPTSIKANLMNYIPLNV